MNRFSRVTEADTAGAQAFLNVERKFMRLHFTRQITCSAEHTVLPCFHVHDICQEKCGGQGVVHAAERAVRVRMHADDRNIMADGEAQDSAGRVIARNTTDRCEDRRMMRNDKLCTAVDCLLYDSLGCVECAEHTRDFGSPVAAQQTYIIPAFSKLRRCKALQKIKYIRYSYHFNPSSAAVSSRTSAC